MSRLAPALIRAIGIAIVFSACNTSEPLREWTPDDHGQPRRDDTEVIPPGAEPETEGDEEDPSLRAARALFNSMCAGCHGRDGRGRGPELPPGAQAADFTDAAFQSARSDADLAKSIREGRNMMPAFAQQLRSEGVDVLVAYVRLLGGGAPGADGAEDAQDMQKPHADSPAAPPEGAPSAAPTPTAGEEKTGATADPVQ